MASAVNGGVVVLFRLAVFTCSADRLRRRVCVCVISYDIELVLTSL
jgi:hypothetical protein